MLTNDKERAVDNAISQYLRYGEKIESTMTAMEDMAVFIIENSSTAAIKRAFTDKLADLRMAKKLIEEE